MAHTADDMAESDWMRDRGATLGALREWSPSPSWPQGRGLMLLRPALAERREDLRAYLTTRGAQWVEDPGNADPRFGRSRARAALAPLGAGEGRHSHIHAGGDRLTALGRPIPLPLGEGFCLGRDASRTVLAAAIVCADTCPPA